MKFALLRIALPAAAIIGIAAAPALAQRPANPEQRIMILEQQLAASQATALRLEQRLDTIERQLQQLINHSETSGHRVGQVESEMRRIRSDVDTRLTAIEARAVVAASSEPLRQESPAQVQPDVQIASTSAPELPSRNSGSAATATSDPGEDAYSEGFRLWRDGNYGQAITALRAFTSGFPTHRRVSFANNLIGRSMLDNGQPRPAAEALLANYRSNPKGERAADSLFYLGQALVKLGQPAQACKAYGELEDVYRASLRDELKQLVSKGKAEAGCS
ncbi:MAG: tetratricopeptide repeat protein [Sphingomonas sp.]|nr:tetratricopeptide repeat protein [Sphingomonas sp.]